MKKVLVVDDSPIIREYIRSILEIKGYEIIGEAGDGYEAVEKYRLAKPDIVTMDIGMPNMNGLEAAKKIVEMDNKASIVIVSGDELQNINRVWDIGIKGFVKKPFENESLINILGQL